MTGWLVPVFNIYMMSGEQPAEQTGDCALSVLTVFCTPMMHSIQVIAVVLMVNIYSPNSCFGEIQIVLLNKAACK